jgi:hypothetical protein
MNGAQALIALFLTEGRRDGRSREGGNRSQTCEQGSDHEFLLGQDRVRD